MAEGVMDIEDGSFDSEVLQSDKPVMVDFSGVVPAKPSARS
jgi:hypothetical protein